jgi:hypothetical protein
MQARRGALVGVVCASSLLVGTVVSLVAFQVGYRAGRGSLCFEAAIHTADASGRTLASLYLSRPGVRSDYSFWGTHCTLSIGFPTASGMDGGQWAYFPSEAKLYAANEAAERLFPGAGRR